MKISFFGAGKMGEAILSGLINKGFNKEEIFVSEIVEERLKCIKEKYGINGSNKSLDAFNFGDILISAVKPQNLKDLSEELKEQDFKDKILLSIMAGVKIEKLLESFKVKKVVRTMPNINAQIGEAVTLWTDIGLNESEREFVRKILSSFGEEIYVLKEDHIDIGTSISGSGPAYVFYFLDALIDAGVYLGLSRDVSEKLSIQTILGSILLKKQTQEEAHKLIHMVTSPGGTTIEALYKFDENRLKYTIMSGVIEAYKKSKLLGESKK
ncbi:MAG: pyrroline-5-carboxylate reductase [Caldisericia bacterium]|nr:pyrroline-5-carboxylate reductase [Caldisericia bacterium]